MHRTNRCFLPGRVAAIAAALGLSSCGVERGSVPAAGFAASQSAQALGSQRFVLPPNVKEVCPHTGAPGVAFCQALQRSDVPSGSPSGYVPADLQSAYNLPSSTGGKNQTVAIVDAFDDPAAESDLFMYRNEFGLPVCSTLNGCFSKLNQAGKPRFYPPPNSNWAIEISIDLDMISATCPNCNIMLIEANSSSWHDLGASVNEAVTLGAHVVANSYGASGKGANPADYNHAGVVIVSPSPDGGYDGGMDNEPSDFPTVVSVGGTTLNRGGGSRGWTEAVWPGSGSGCSSFTKPTWQHDAGCKRRTANDIAADANPSTGVAVYDSYKQSGWQQIGGDSIASDIISGVFGLAGNANQFNGAESFYQSGATQYLFDMTTGANGSCSHRYLCTAEVGFDGPSGWGTPDGVGAF